MKEYALGLLRALNALSRRPRAIRFDPLPSGGILGDAKPLFMIGPPRSGTTMLAKLVNSHKQVVMTNESAVPLQLDVLIRQGKQGSNAGVIFGKTYYELWSGLLRNESRRLLESFYYSVAKVEGKSSDLRYWGEKHPHMHNSLQFLGDAFPDATFIYVVRDPRDSACSIAEMNGWEFERGLKVWRKFSRAYEAFVEEIGSDRIIKIKYEDFVRDYVAGAEDLFSSLGLSVDKGVREFAVTKHDLDAHKYGVKAIASRRDFKKTSVARWRRDISAEQNALALAEVGGFITKYGYQSE